jgi:hypothetical protein
MANKAEEWEAKFKKVSREEFDAFVKARKLGSTFSSLGPRTFYYDTAGRGTDDDIKAWTSTSNYITDKPDNYMILDEKSAE